MVAGRQGGSARDGLGARAAAGSVVQMRRSLLTVDGFAPEAERLRAHFDERFAQPRSTRGDRFVWDLWHVPGQYTALRTPAWLYFPKRLYDAFHQRLVWWGRRTLGCHDVSPPWMSCYVEGCRQELHGDLPHGQWAFVFSLTRWRTRKFRGGETLLLREELLDYWGEFASTRGLEEGEILEAVPSRFNRLVAFDPRIPHGVRRVEGTMDPREGRLVIHGWFVQPRPFIEGPLPRRELQRVIDGTVMEVIHRELGGGMGVAGMLSVRLEVEASGKVGAARVLCDTTRVPKAEEPARRRLVRAIVKAARGLRFGRRGEPSQVTLPLVFER